MYIFIYISIYILKKRTRVGHAFFSKERNVLGSFAFFCKRMLRSLHSFRFFAKERWVLCVLLHSLQKNVVFFAFFYVLKKRRQNNASFFWVSEVAKNSKKECKRMLRAFKERKRMLRAFKERKRTMRSERKRTQCPTLKMCNLDQQQIFLDPPH